MPISTASTRTDNNAAGERSGLKDSRAGEGLEEEGSRRKERLKKRKGGSSEGGVQIQMGTDPCSNTHGREEGGASGRWRLQTMQSPSPTTLPPKIRVGKGSLQNHRTAGHTRYLPAAVAVSSSTPRSHGFSRNPRQLAPLQSPIPDHLTWERYGVAGCGMIWSPIPTPIILCPSDAAGDHSPTATCYPVTVTVPVPVRWQLLTRLDLMANLRGCGGSSFESFYHLSSSFQPESISPGL